MADEVPLRALEGWVAALTARLKPGQRIRLARRIGTVLRRVNAKRITANVEPDGAKMEARKPRPAGKKASGRRGRMFKRMGKLKSMRIRARADSVRIDFEPRLSRVARVHHFGLQDRVERGEPARARYPRRRLLGLADTDREAIMDEVLGFLGD